MVLVMYKYQYFEQKNKKVFTKTWEKCNIIIVVETEKNGYARKKTE